MPTPPTLSRRTAVGALVAVTGAVVAGCTASSADRRAATLRHPARARRAGVDPDVALAATVLRDEQAMLDRLVATQLAHPRLAGVLAGARAAHRAHVALLTRAVPRDEPRASPSDAGSASPSGAASSTGSGAPTPGPTTAPVPARVVPALAALANAEHRLSLLGRRSSLAARSGAFARVLASMAAAAAQQDARLTSVAQARR